MFSRGSKSGQTETSPTKPAALAEREPARGKTRPSGVASMIGQGLTIEGNLQSGGEIRIQGAVKGDISAVSVTVEENGRVDGTVAAEAIRIGGTVEGKVRGSAVAIARTARVVGDVYHGKLSIEEGAMFEGSVRQVDPKGAGRKAADKGAGNSRDGAS